MKNNRRNLKYNKTNPFIRRKDGFPPPRERQNQESFTLVALIHALSDIAEVVGVAVVFVIIVVIAMDRF